MIAYLNIGSNLGSKKDLILRALDCIGDKLGYYCVSEFVESDPWGFDSTNSFLNIGVAIKTQQEPETLLDTLQGIEKSISGISHRDEKGGYADREIDIDIMAFDKGEYKSERLEVPHRHLKAREFFLRPLMELAPHWQYPSSGESIESLLFGNVKKDT